MIDGVFVEKPRCAVKAFLVTELAYRMGGHVHAADAGYVCGPGMWVGVAPGVVRDPDVCFTSWNRRPEWTAGRAPISRTVPELAVDILTAANTRGEMARKRVDYFLAGVRLVWEIDPADRSAAAFTAPDAHTPVDTLDGGDVLPGFRLPLATLFARLAPPAPKKRRK